MENKWVVAALTAIAPIAWGSNYYIGGHVLPQGRPLFNAAFRALPVGIALVAWTRTLPRGDWWWKSALLGTLNIGAFFFLIYVASERLPSGLAATLMALSPAAMLLLAWPMVGERPSRWPVFGSIIGIAGVALLVLEGGTRIDWVGILASATAMLMATVGFLLGKRWQPPVPMLTFTAWQLLAGGLVLAPLAFVIEGAPPAISGQGWLAFAYTWVVTTGIAYVVWFRGLSLLPASTVGLIGLLNPVTGVVVGTVVAHEVFGWRQAVGTAAVLSGILLGQRRSSAKPAPVSPGAPTLSTTEQRPAATSV